MEGFLYWYFSSELFIESVVFEERILTLETGLSLNPGPDTHSIYNLGQTTLLITLSLSFFFVVVFFNLQHGDNDIFLVGLSEDLIKKNESM